MDLREQSQSVENTAEDLTLNAEVDMTPEDVEETISEEVSLDAPADSNTPNKEDIIAQLEVIAAKDGADITREEVTHLKLQFYTIRKNELAVEKQEFLDRGNEESAFAPKPDPEEEKIHSLLNNIKEKKAAHIAQIEAERKENLEKKLHIIAQLSEMADDTDNVNRHFPRFRELTQEYKTIGEVPPTDATDLYRNYTSAVERFYDQLKVNKDLRDYDFKKNLEQKQLLIELAEKLLDEPDVIIAFRRLQELHDKWKETGPVAKELREDIWAKFKDVSAQINKRYQGYFEERKSKERENEEKKTAICERIEAIDMDTLKTFADWDRTTRLILEAQEEWKKLGFASKKVNNALFARFRKTCDLFFEKKAEFFKNVKDNYALNLEKKIALCEKAEALKDSTDWKKTADELVNLQKEWKTVGTVDKKHSDAVWKRFLEACDYFFDQRKKATSGVRKTEQANLKQKQDIIQQLKQIDEITDAKEASAKIKELVAAWGQVGHVPFKDKDKVYKAYHELVNKLYDKFDVKETKAHMNNFAASIDEMSSDENRLYRERERLARACEQKKNELKTYENNLGFFNITSKNGNNLLKEMERKIQRLKDDVATLQEKIKLIDGKL